MSGEPSLARARQWLAADRFEEALEAAYAWLAVHPDDPAGLVVAAEAELLLGRYARSRGLADTVLGVEPDHLDALRIGTQARRRGGDAAAALGAAERWCALDPDDLSAWCELTQCLASAGRVPAARAACRTAAGLCSPDSPVDLVELGRAQLAARDRTAAERSARAALALDPGFEDAHGLLVLIGAARRRLLGTARGGFDLLLRHHGQAILPQAARLVLLLALGGTCVVGGAIAVLFGIASLFWSPLRLAGLVVPILLALTALGWVLVARRWSWRLIEDRVRREGSRLPAAAIRIAVGLVASLVWALVPSPWGAIGAAVAVGAFVAGMLALAPHLAEETPTRGAPEPRG